MLDDYNAMLANRSQPVRILDKLNPYEGIAIGIDREGELLVKSRRRRDPKRYAQEKSP